MIYKSLLAQALEYFVANKNTKTDVEQLQANVDYISMMSDINLNDEEENTNGNAEEQNV